MNKKPPDHQYAVIQGMLQEKEDIKSTLKEILKRIKILKRKVENFSVD